MKTHRHTLTRLSLALLLLHAGHAQTATVTWVGPNFGSWSLQANWSGNAPPTAVDDVLLGSSNVTINDSAVAASVVGTGMLQVLDQSGLTLTGDSSLGGLDLGGTNNRGVFRNSASTEISGPLLWRSGNIVGAGTTRVQGATTLTFMAGTAGNNLGPGHTLILNGTTRARTEFFEGTLGIVGARLVNRGTWLDQANANTSFTNVIGDLERGNFDNLGAFTKQTATVTTFERGVLFNNSGTVRVNAGTLRIAGGGGTGSFNVAEGAALTFGIDEIRASNAPTIYALDGAVTSAGTLTIDGKVSAANGLQLAGNTVVNHPLNLHAASSFVNLRVNNAPINFDSTFLVTGVWDWAGGILSGGSDPVVRSTGTLLLSGSAPKRLFLTNLVASGSTQQTGTGFLQIEGNVQNLGTWSEQATGDNAVGSIGSVRFANEGTFNKDSAFTTTVGNVGGRLVFHNTGTVNVNAGTLQLLSNFNNQGLINVASTGVVQNVGNWSEQATGNNLVDGAGRFDNEGTFNKDSAFITTLGGNGLVFNNTGTVNVNAGTLRLASSFNNQGVINLAGGAELDGAHASFASAGTLAGSGTVRALDTFTNTGILAPGGVGQVGQLQVLGNLATSGSLQVDLSRSGGDLLAVSGTATLGGALNFSVLGSQRLERGSSFTVMSWGQRAVGSEFASLNFSQASGYRFATAYGATGLSVTVTGLPYTWTGAAAGGVWDVVNNWNAGNDGLPQAGDTVLLGSADTRIRSVMSVGDVSGTGSLSVEAGGHLVLGGSGSVGGLQMRSGSQLTNSGRLVATGDSSWVGAVLRGPGVTRIEGAFAIAGNDFDSSPGLLNNHTLELAGTTTYTGRRGMSVGDGATLVNQGTWVDQAPTNVTLGNFNGGAGRFLNQGTFTKASSTRTLIGEGTSMVFESTGTINVDAGYLRLSSSRVSSTGQVNIAAGAELSMASFDATLGGSVFNEGTLSLDGGVLTIAGDLLVQGNGLTRVKSTVNNNSVLRITGTVDWVESTLRGTGSTRMEGPVLLTGDRSRGVLGGQTVELAGTTTQVGTGGLSIGQGARLRNLGTWLDAAAGNVGIGNFNGGATPHFENVGSFTKTSAFVTEIGNGLNFINTGTLDIQAGTLRISDNATLTAGQVKIASGATLDLSSGSIALKGTVQNAGTLALSGATVEVTSTATVKGGLTTFKGVLANTGQLRMTGNVDWFEGDLRGSGTTRMDGALALRGGASRQLRNGQTLELAGTTTQVDASNLLMANGARLVNRGHWVDAANGNVFLGTNSGDTNHFDNIGQFTKTSAFVTTIGNGLVFNNTGTLDLQAGTLSFSESFNNQGLLRLAAGAELASSVANLANAGTLAGDGTVRTASSFFSLKNTGTLAAGGLGDAGTLSLVGGLAQEASGIFLVDLGSTAAGGFDLLSISGAATLGGTLAVNLLAGAHFNVGDSFTVMTWTQRLGNSQFASLDLTQAGGYGFEADYGATSLTLRVMTAPVPEPESWALMAAGLAGLGALQRRRRARASA